MLVIYGTCKQIFILEKQSSGSVLKKGVLRNFAGNFLIILQAATCNFVKKETLAQVFFCEFCRILKNIFFLLLTLPSLL